MPEPDAYLIRYGTHRVWLERNGHGYTPRLSLAGRYSHDEVVDICARAIPGAANTPLVPVPAAVMAAIQARYTAEHPDREHEPWE